MAKKKEKDTAIVPAGGVDNLPANVQEMYAEDAKGNMDNVEESFHALSIKGGRFTINEVLTGDRGIAFPGVMLKEIPVNMFYEGVYDPDNVAPPECFSVGGIDPDASVQSPISPSCIGCPNNVFGSGSDKDGNPGKGKACKNSLRAVIHVPGIDLLFLLSIPASSLKDYKIYLKKLTSLSLPLAAVTTEITFDAGAEFPKLIFELKECLPVELYKEMKELRDSDEVSNVLKSFSSGDATKKEGTGEVKDDDKKM